jgi:putative ABC transport system substrate-binding protein
MKLHETVLAAAFALAWAASAVRAGDVAVIVASGDVPMYRAALQGAEAGLAGQKLRVFDLQGRGVEENRREARRIAAWPFDGIVAIGARAAQLGLMVHGSRPLVCCMTLAAPPAGAPHEGPVEVLPYLPPLGQFTAFHRRLAPSSGPRLGVLWSDPALGGVLDAAAAAATAAGVTLVPRRIGGAADVPAALTELIPGIDAFWLLPDPTLLGPETVSHLLLVLLENERPVMTFSRHLAEGGALFALAYDPQEVGRQTAALAVGLLAGAGAPQAPGLEPLVTVNGRVARLLGLRLPEPLPERWTVLGER